MGHNSSMPQVFQVHAARHHLSDPRFATYRRYCADDMQAMQLYRWNLEVSGAVFEMLGVVEVAVRNAIDVQLRAWNASGGGDPEWLKAPKKPLYGLLVTQPRYGKVKSTFEDAKHRAQQDSDLRWPGHPRHGHAVTHDDVVAHVMFGTWVNLLPDPRLKEPAARAAASKHARQRESRREVLWEASLKDAFPGQGGRYTVSYWLRRLYELRNRVAHHEPLILADLVSYHRTASRLLRAVDPRTGDWYSGISRVPALVAACPLDMTAHRSPR